MIGGGVRGVFYLDGWWRCVIVYRVLWGCTLGFLCGSERRRRWGGVGALSARRYFILFLCGGGPR